MYVTVLYSYKKHCRIVRFSNENTMMHALDGLFLSSMHNNVTRVDFLIFHTPHFPHSSFSTLLIFHTPHFPHSSFSTLLIFHTPHIPHSSFSTLRTPRFPPNRNFESPRTHLLRLGNTFDLQILLFRRSQWNLALVKRNRRTDFIRNYQILVCKNFS